MTPDDPEGRAAHRRWRRRPDAAWRTTLRGVVVLPAGAAEPVTVAGSGGAVWALLDRPRSLDELVTTLSARYGSPPEPMRRDVAALLRHLDQLGALEEVSRPHPAG